MDELSLEEAINLLPDGEYIHTFRGSRMLFGADWKREDIIKLFNTKKPQLSGGKMARMNHGLTVDDDGWLFIETKKL